MRKNKKKKYAVYFTTDENYWKHSFVAILSLFKFNKFLDVYLLYSNLSSKNVKFFKQFFGKKLTLIKFKKNNLSKIHSYIKGYYLRYFIPDILFKYKKILYLDSDIIVCDNIEKIFNLKINKTIGAVKEAKSTQNPLFHLKKLTKARFNTGVLLIHTKRYRDKII